MRGAIHSDGTPAENPHGLLKCRSRRFLITAALVAAIGTAIYEGCQALRQRHQLQAFREERALLARQIQQLQQERDDAVKGLAASSAEPKPRLPASPIQATAEPNATSAEGLQSTNLYARFKDNPPKLTPEQVEAYLKASGRKSANLLAAYRTSGDSALLTEAMQNFPNDPVVTFEAVFKGDLSPEERRQWLNTFKQADPDNALPNYLSARECFKAGQSDQALQELMAASGKQQFQDYTRSRWQDDEEAYLAAGYSTAEAKMLASGQLKLPQLSELKQLGVQMVEVSNSYRQAGDDASAQEVLQMAVGLGQSYSAGDCAISHLVGVAIQRIALNAMDPNSPYGNSGSTVQEQLDQLNQRKTSISLLFKENESLLENMSDQDWINYIDRDKSFGEEAALRWAITRLKRNEASGQPQE